MLLIPIWILANVGYRQRVLAADERVLSEPVARVFVQDLGNNGVELVAWPFVKAEDYALVQAEI